jgi:hypothetical protein
MLQNCPKDEWCRFYFFRDLNPGSDEFISHTNGANMVWEIKAGSDPIDIYAKAPML